MDRSEELYQAAALAVKRALAEFESMHHHPDGSHAIDQAARKETAALRKYRQALSDYRECLLKRRRDSTTPE